MSCCSGCQQGMGCNGLGELTLDQIAALENYVVAGSTVEWGGRILLNGSDVSAGWDDSMEAAIKNALWNHGGFSMVDAGSIAGFFRRYISIRVTTRVDFAHLGDIETTIEGAIYAAGFRPVTENFWVLSVPQAAYQKPGAAQPNASAAPQSGGPAISFPNFGDIFGGSPGGSDSNPIDRFADWLGVGQTTAALIGVGLGIGAVVLVKRLL